MNIDIEEENKIKCQKSPTLPRRFFLNHLFFAYKLYQKLRVFDAFIKNYIKTLTFLKLLPIKLCLRVKKIMF